MNYIYLHASLSKNCKNFRRRSHEERIRNELVKSTEDNQHFKEIQLKCDWLRGSIDDKKHDSAIWQQEKRINCFSQGSLTQDDDSTSFHETFHSVSRRTVRRRSLSCSSRCCDSHRCCSHPTDTQSRHSFTAASSRNSSSRSTSRSSRSPSVESVSYTHLTLPTKA